MGNFASKNTINDASYQGLKAINGAALTQISVGTGEFLRARYKAAVATTPIEFEFPSNSDGVNISTLAIYVEPATPLANTTLALLVTIDAADAAEAAARLTVADSLDSDILWIPVEVGVVTVIPIEGGLTNGFVHVKASGATTLNVWMGVQ